MSSTPSTGAIDDLSAGDGGVVVIHAAAGLGKTALLEHAAEAATRAGWRVRR